MFYNVFKLLNNNQCIESRTEEINVKLITVNILLRLFSKLCTNKLFGSVSWTINGQRKRGYIHLICYDKETH
jgi:hypothetical protein